MHMAQVFIFIIVGFFFEMFLISFYIEMKTDRIIKENLDKMYQPP